MCEAAAYCNNPTFETHCFQRNSSKSLPYTYYHKDGRQVKQYGMWTGRETGLHDLAKKKTKTKKQAKAQIPSPGSQWDEHGRKMKASV